MLNHQYASKRHPCPHCGHDSGCKTFFDGAEQIEKVWCLRVLSNTDVQPHWQRVGWLRNGMGGVLIPMNPQAPSGERWPKEERLPIPSELPLLAPAERDRDYRQIVHQFGFSSKHRQALRQRGLTDSEIDLAVAQQWLVTWQPRELVFAHRALAGVNPQTRRLTGVDGFAIAALNPHNQITGFQIACDHRKTHKYLWVSSKKHNGNGPQLPNGELPLFFWHHPSATQKAQEGLFNPSHEEQVIYLIEGALKSLIAAFQIWRTNPQAIIIGTATAARYGRKTLEEYLGNRTGKNWKGEILTQQGFQPKPKIRLLPDAGSITNRHIYQANCQTLNFLMSGNFDIEVGNWGQWFDKTAPDFDELLRSDTEVLPLSDSIGSEHFYWASVQEYLKPEEQTPRSWLNRLKRLPMFEWVKSQLSRWGLTLPTETPTTIEFRPGMKLPRPDGQTPLKIVFEAGQRLELFRTLQEQGWQFIHDSSAPGSGKSFDFGRLGENNARPVLYIDKNHRNPSTATVEANFTDLPTRHNGLAVVPDHFTPSGQPHLRRATGSYGEIIYESSNCYQAETFNLLRGKGYNIEPQSLCKDCDFLYGCRGGEQPHGYIGKMNMALNKRYLRCHFDALPSPDLFNYEQGIGILEEASSNLAPTYQQEVWSQELTVLWDELESQLPDIYEALKPFKLALRDIFMQRISPSSRWGFTFQDLQQILPPPPENLAEICEILEQFQFPWEDYITTADSVPVTKEWKISSRLANRRFREEAKQQTLNGLKKIPPHILLNLVKIWGNLQPGAFRIQQHKLILTTLTIRQTSLIQRFRTVILLDATATREELARQLQISPQAIIQMEQKTTPPPNLTIVNVQLEGMKSSHYSALCRDRQKKLIPQILKRHGYNIDHIDWDNNQQRLRELGLNAILIGKKKDEHLPIDGHWYNHNRATNEFQGIPLLIAFGTPNPNVGSIQDQYYTLTGSLEGFDQYYAQQQVQVELEQLVGRQRAHLYPDQQFHIYFIGTDLNLSFLQAKGFQVEQYTSFEIAPEAGTPRQVQKWKLLQFAEQLVQSGQKLTQKNLAPLVGLNQGQISKLGWRHFQALFQKALNDSSRDLNIFQEHAKALENKSLREWLELDPLEILTESVEMIQKNGWEMFSIALAGFDLLTQLKILGMIAPFFLPQPELKEFINTIWTPLNTT